ncbi:hypothetical protein PWT90_03466 [Aphanocladium album]|nr:hypothetical protein PWT90_03466 [Aphanocladium album]
MLFIQSLAILASMASATSFQAWSGDSCDGAAGSRVGIDRKGSCEKVDGRHSWSVDGDNVKGFYYSSDGCHGQSTQFYANDKTCVNINTGYGVSSMCVVGVDNRGCGL